MKEVIGNHDGITMFLLEPENEVISVHSKFCLPEDTVCKPINAPNCQKLTDTFAGLTIEDDVIDEYYELVSEATNRRSYPLNNHKAFNEIGLDKG